MLKLQLPDVDVIEKAVDEAIETEKLDAVTAVTV